MAKATVLKTFNLAVLSLVFVFLGSCSEPQTDAGSEPQAQTPAPQTPAEKTYTDTGDFSALAKYGKLRLLAPRWQDTGLPREGLPNHGYRELAEQFVAALGLQVEWIFADNHSQLIDMLSQGKGDLIVAHLTQTPQREQRIAFSVAISSAHEQIVSNPIPLQKAEQLEGKKIAVGRGSSFVNSLKAFALANPSVSFEIVEQQQGDPEWLLDQINAGEFDATVMDNNVIHALSEHRDDIQAGMTITPTRPIAWATRKNNPQLLARLNTFLTESRITQVRRSKSVDDFPAIKQRKVLRMITRNSPASYFLWRGELMGYEYDLIKKFAQRQGLRLEVEVAPPGTDMINMLQNGDGDLIAAGMSITAERKARGLAFTRHYHRVHEQIVTHSKTAPIESLENLAGRTLVIHPDHAYWQTALTLLNQGHAFKLVAAEKHQTSVDLMQAVAQGEIDATIADSHLVGIESNFSETLAPGLELPEQQKLGWIVRDTNPELLKALNHYIKLHYRGHFFNVTYNKYFRNEKRIDKYQGQRLTSGETLSPYDELIRPLAAQYHFDWRMLVSQMYQESKFNPRAKSFAGALGLFQVMPRTAKELGIPLPLTPETGILAGVQYLDWTRDRFESHLPLEERLWFALAAYNAGFGHVNDARRLARQKGWNGDVWFDNVERAMLLLSKREYYQKARFGYVRGSEPVNYVRQIKDRYYAYLAL